MVGGRQVKLYPYKKKGGGGSHAGGGGTSFFFFCSFNTGTLSFIHAERGAQVSPL